MNERTPLLVSHEANNTSPRCNASYLQHCKSIWQTWKVPVLCYILALLVDSAEAMRSTPKTRLFEIILCRRYYAAADSDPDTPRTTQPDIPEHMCKAPDVQSAVVTTKLWLKIGESLFALILAIPFGKLSNKRGRKLVLALGVTGQVLAEGWIVAVCFFDAVFPFDLVYASSIFKSLGGGQMVLSAIVHAILADVVSEERRAQAFFHMASVSLGAEVIAPLMGSILMQARGVYAPLLCGFPLQVLAIAALLLIPQSVDHVHDLDEEQQSNRGEMADGSSERDTKTSGLQIMTKKVLRKAKTSWALIRSNGRTLVVAISFLVTYLGKDTLDFLVH
ncbi:hypothetical protein BBP40_007833 [Aspergillus hancockii]|nr:hypothetical protein BBP40_007833 [Aspergillus hancockii]